MKIKLTKKPKKEERIMELKTTLRVFNEADVAAGPGIVKGQTFKRLAGDEKFPTERLMVRIANFVNVNAEDSLRKTIRKFIQRFKHIEAGASRTGRKLSEMRLDEMEVLWNEAKKK